MKQQDDSLDQARAMWDDLVTNHVAYFGDVTPAMNEVGLKKIAALIKQKKIGCWDELMSDEELAQTMSEQSLTNDVLQLIGAWCIRTTEARQNVTPPTENEEIKSLYQLVSQIFKTLKVEQD